MSQMIGADVDGLRGLASFFDSSAARLGEIERSLSQGFCREVWRGSDAQEFRGRWDGSLAPSLRAVQQSLADAAVTLRRNADDQEKTSNDLSGAGGGSGDLSSVLGPVGSGAGGEPGDLSSVLGPADSGYSPDGVIDSVVPGEGSLGVDLPNKVVLAEGELGIGTEHSISGKTNLHGVDVEGEANVRAGAFANGEIALTKDGITATGQVMAGVTASAAGSAAIAGMGVSGEVKATAGAMAEGQASLGKDGLKLSGDAFAGAKVEGSASAEVAGVKGTVSGEAWAGVGASVDAGATFKDGKLKISGSLGVAIGVGGKVGGEVEIDVAKTVDSVIDVAKGIKRFFGR